jgi:catechol 2,3-dioxygenase-like lactoylglutathione lyase family enzyme
MARLRHFAGCVKNLEKSAKFYSKVFDLNEVGREDIDIGWIRMGSYSIFHITAGSEPTAGDDWTAIPHRHSPRIAGNATCRIVALCRSVEIPLGARRTICPAHPRDAFGDFRRGPAISGPCSTKAPLSVHLPLLEPIAGSRRPVFGIPQWSYLIQSR